MNVPADLHPVCDLLPRLPSQAQIVPMKLKRRLCYKGHYMYEYVRPAKVLAALEWLINNPLYKDVAIDHEWVKNAAVDNSQLWEAISSQQCEQPPQQTQSPQPYPQKTPLQTPLQSQQQTRRTGSKHDKYSVQFLIF